MKSNLVLQRLHVRQLQQQQVLDKRLEHETLEGVSYRYLLSIHATHSYPNQLKN